MFKWIDNLFAPKWHPWSKPIHKYGGKYVQIRFRISDNFMESRDCLDEVDINRHEFEDQVRRSMDPLFKINYDK